MIENVSGGGGTPYQNHFVKMSNSWAAREDDENYPKKFTKKKLSKKNSNIPQYQSNVYWSNQDDLNHDI